MARGSALRTFYATLLLAVVLAASGPTLALAVDPGRETIPLGPHLLVIPDPHAAFAMADVAAGRHDRKALPPSSRVPNLGYVRHPHWVRFELENAGDEPLHRILVLRRGTKHVQDIHVRSGSATRQLLIGQDGIASGDVKSRHAVVRLTLQPRSMTAVTIRVNSRTGVALDYVLTSEPALARTDALDTWLYGVLFGIGLVIGIYSLFVFGATRENIYLWFSGFALIGVLYQMHFEAFAFVALWGRAQVVGNYASLYLGVLYALCATGFLRRIVEADRIMPRIDRWLFKPIFLLLFTAFPLFPRYWWVANTIAVLGTAVGTLSLGAAAVVAVMRGSVRVKSIPIAVLVLAVAGTIFMLKQAGLVPDLPAFAALFPLAFGLAMLAFALAIAERLRLIAADNRLAVKRNEDRLEQTVAERTDALREANEVLLRMASHDGLTRIANRSAFDAALAELWEDHRQRGASLAIIMCDIDFFKAYNDTYGHQAGDTALIRVAAALQAQARSGVDVAARYGGEEFALLLANLTPEAASAAATRLLEAVRQLGIPHRASTVASHITLSIGVVALVPDATTSPEQAIGAADLALYRAKHEGRDQVVVGGSGIAARIKQGSG
ncbi:MAG: diguanylate cyclase [Gammaproteobacteria bacterium]|nr:diguanylate cyclase [Gammaproteobacteria bacterium]